MSALDLTAGWPVDSCQRRGRARRARSSTPSVTSPARFALASFTKPLVAWAILVAVGGGGAHPRRRGRAAGLHDASPAEPCRRLPVRRPPHRSDRRSARRGYSNTGIEIAADALDRGVRHADGRLPRRGGARSRSAWATPRSPDRRHTAPRDASPTWSGSWPRCARPPCCRRRPATLRSSSTYPELSGIVPGVGRFAPCPWGLGFELRGDKSPHWTATNNSSRTVGHFGGAGTMFWFDPGRRRRASSR